MPKQTFLSKEFFVNASEKDTQQVLLSLPQFLQHIKLMSKATTTLPAKFLYQRAEPVDHHVDVSLLPLDHHFTSVCLHVSYANGNVFQKDRSVLNSLSNFEQALQAALNGKLSEYTPKETPVSSGKKLTKLALSVLASLSFFILWRKLS